jgi:hypothetical protein
MAASDYMENAIINWLRGTAFPGVPTNVYVALFTTATSDAGGGTEVSGGSYARAEVAASAAAWTAPSGGNGETENVDPIAFPTATASWGTITHLALFDAASGGNMLYHGALTESKTVGADDSITIGAGAFVLTVS